MLGAYDNLSLVVVQVCLLSNVVSVVLFLLVPCMLACVFATGWLGCLCNICPFLFILFLSPTTQCFFRGSNEWICPHPSPNAASSL